MNYDKSHVNLRTVVNVLRLFSESNKCLTVKLNMHKLFS